MNRRLVIPAVIAFTLAFFFGWTNQTFAQGIIIDRQEIQPWIDRLPPQSIDMQPITLESESIVVELDDQFAHVKTTQIFRNNTGMDVEGTYIFPLPPGADISDFALWFDGKKLTCETMEAQEAAQIYHDIVSKMRDPGLLEYVGDGLIRANVYPIPRNGTKQVDLEFDWLLPIDGDLMRLELPLKLDGYSVDRIESLAITVNITSPDTLGTIYSPTHEVRVDHNGPTSATASFEESSHRPSGDFVLYIGRPEKPVGVNLLTHSTSGDEGYFLAMVAPEYDESNTTVVPKDFACVLDTSGSMAGEKIEQAKKALAYIFQNLNADDRFRLMTFATDVYPYSSGWTDATRENVSDVSDFIDGIDAGGSTNIDGALQEALGYESGGERPMYVIFLTDGLPTVGERDTAKIIENTNSTNSRVDGRIFCFGVGDDVDYQFIDRLARENGGYTANVAPDEDLEQPLSDLYAKIKSPVMTDLAVEITGARIYDMLPDELPDLFLGSQLILAGRFNGTGSGDVTLTGKVGSRDVRYRYPVQFTDERANDFIPRHWATRRVGYLLNQIRLYGENEEVVDEIVDLAKRYGIVTPYTSMLVTEDIPTPMPGGPMIEDRVERGNWLGDIFGGGRSANPTAPSGSGEALRMESRDVAAMEAGGSVDMAQGSQERVRFAGDKTFYLNPDNYWVDSVFEGSGLEPTHIAYLGDEYIKLLSDKPELTDYLTVSDRMIVVWDKAAYQIDPSDEQADPSKWPEVVPKEKQASTVASARVILVVALIAGIACVVILVLLVLRALKARA